MGREIDCRYTDEIICPHCGYEHGDSWEVHFESDGCTEFECNECRKTFHVERDVTVKYISKKMEHPELLKQEGR